LAVLKTPFSSVTCSAFAARSTSSLRLAAHVALEHRAAGCTCRTYPTRRAAAGTTFGALPLARIAPLQVQRFEPKPIRLLGALSASPVCAGFRLSRKTRRPQSWTGRGFVENTAINLSSLQMSRGMSKRNEFLTAGVSEKRAKARRQSKAGTPMDLFLGPTDGLAKAFLNKRRSQRRDFQRQI
jgi:hypothetical protein